MDIARFFSWQRVIPQFQSGKRAGHLRLLKISSTRRVENCARRCTSVDRSIRCTPHAACMEQIAQREKRDTEDYACQIKIMADAVLLPPMHKREQLKCFRHMRKNHHDDASCAELPMHVPNVFGTG